MSRMIEGGTGFQPVIWIRDVEAGIMRHHALQSAIVLLIAIAAMQCAADDSRFHYELRATRQIIESYHLDTGEWPQTDAAGTWVDKIVEWNSLFIEWFDYLKIVDTPNGRILVDWWDQPIVYEPPADPDGIPLIRCVGENGIDDGGTLDDLDSDRPPNIGYWYRSDWPALYLSLVIVALVSLIVVWVAWRLIRAPLVRLAAIMLIVGGLFSVVPSLFGAGLARARPDFSPRWVHPIANIAAIIALLSLVVLLIQFIHISIHGNRRSRIHAGLCADCGYDLRGITSERCPECGHRREQL